MIMGRVLTVEELKKKLHYNPHTGIFTNIGKWNGRKQNGSMAGTQKKKNGYISICVNYKEYGAHQLAWLYMTGEFCKTIIDHKDRIKYNNKWENLIQSDYHLNAQNSKKRTDNKSGVTGVHFKTRLKKWFVDIQINGIRKYLGIYKSFDNAVCARLAGEQCLNWNSGIKGSSADKYVKNNITRRYV